MLGEFAVDCQNCGAPLDWDGSRPIIICDFCSSMRSIDSTGDSLDRVVELNLPGKSNCPRCHEQLTVAAIDGVKVEHCEQCRGILMEGDLFATVVRNRRADFRGSESRPVPLDAAQLKITVDCPSCEQPMEVHPYYGPGNIVIDSCCRCRLVWLDSGEMATIEIAPGSR